MSDKKPDLFTALDRVANNDIGYFANLTDEEVKKLPPFLLMKWLAGTPSKSQILNISETVNQYCFSLYQHPRLLHKMLISASTSKSRLSFLKRPSTAGQSLTVSTVSDYYECSIREAKETLELVTSDDIMTMATELGYDKETTAKLKKELNGK